MIFWIDVVTEQGTERVLMSATGAQDAEEAVLDAFPGADVTLYPWPDIENLLNQQYAGLAVLTTS